MKVEQKNEELKKYDETINNQKEMMDSKDYQIS